MALVVCIGFGAYKFWNKEGTQNTQEWVNYEFDIKNVAVKFPAAPLVDTQATQSIRIEMVRLKKSNNQYIISILTGKNFTEGDYYPYSLIKKGASITSSKDVNVNGFLGTEYSLKLNGQPGQDHELYLDLKV